MKKSAISILFLTFLLFGLIGCGDDGMKDLYGTYIFEEVSYISPLSSSFENSITERMTGTEYIVGADLFRIGYADDPVEINMPVYKKEKPFKGLNMISDIGPSFDEKVIYQYTIYTKNDTAIHQRLYVSQDHLWIASYTDNTADGSEIIMHIYMITRK
jgi:hypothetical protein